MDAASLIIEALKAGLAEATSATTKDAYATVKNLVVKRLRGRPDAEVILRRFEANPKEWQGALGEELAVAKADQDSDLIKAAQIVLAHVYPQLAATGKYNVQAAGNVYTIVQGDNMQVTIHAQPEQPAELSDLPMKYETFQKVYKPKLEQEGYRVVFPQPDGVHEKQLEGWEEVYIKDTKGNLRRAVIMHGDRVDLVPMKKKGG